MRNKKNISHIAEYVMRNGFDGEAGKWEKDFLAELTCMSMRC